MRRRRRTRSSTWGQFWRVAGNLALALTIATAMLVGTVAYRGHRLDLESRAFVDDSVLAIAGDWSSDALLARATPELRAMAEADKVRSSFATYAQQLGRLAEYQGATGDAVMSYTGDKSTSIKASYVARARFQTASASIWVVLVKRDDRWMISGFQVQPMTMVLSDRAN